MQYMIRTEMAGFLQFVSLPDQGDSLKYPEVAQIRADVYFLSRLLQTMQEAIKHVDHVEKTFHDSQESRNHFDYGFHFFSAGTIPFSAIVQSRTITVYAAGAVLFSKANPRELIKPIEKALLEL